MKLDKVLEFERQNTRLLSEDVRVRVPSAPPRRGSQVIKASVCKTDIEGLNPSPASNIRYSGWEAIKCHSARSGATSSGCNSVWSEYSAWTREVVGSNPATLTSLLRLKARTPGPQPGNVGSSPAGGTNSAARTNGKSRPS